MKKHFENFEDLNQEIEIAKLQKDLQYLKVKKQLSNTLDELKPKNLVSGALSAVGESIQSNFSINEILIKWWEKYRNKRSKSEHED